MTEREEITDEQVVISEEQRLIDVLMQLDVSDKDALKDALNKIISVRLQNELIVNQGFAVGIATDKITIQDAQDLMKKSKDSLSDLVKLVQLLEGNATDNVAISVAQRDELAELVRGELNRVDGASGF